MKLSTKTFWVGFPGAMQCHSTPVCWHLRRARKVIEEHRQEVKRIAEALLAEGSLMGDELRDLVAQQPRLKQVGPPERKTG